AELRARAETFDVWSVPSLGAFGNGRALNWIKAGSEIFRLTYPWKAGDEEGHETLTVERDLVGHWGVSLTFRPTGAPYVKGQPPPPRPASRQRTLAAGIVTSDAAAGLAEAFVLQERRQAANLKDKAAPWRQGGASEKQLGMLRRLKIPFKPGITKGQASDLIDVAQARRGR
ncbi:MAG TPA: hypothetical protein VK506_16475, partial [Conexibacter sp.]|nr:hypothetical protein [Conexibacter sp.]